MHRTTAQIEADARYAKWLQSFQAADRKAAEEQVAKDRADADDLPDDEAMEGEEHDDECPMCHGTGEGAFDGQSCPSCKGRGHLGGLKY